MKKAGSLDTGFFVTQARHFRGFRPVQAYRAIFIPSRHMPSLVLS
jgi:hypothetical protein